MCIYITSDLHLGVSVRGDRTVGGLARFLERRGTPEDILIVAGDIATDDEHILQCLRLFHGFPGQKAAIAGNHDVWVEPNTITSLARYQGLPGLFRQAGFHPLEELPLLHGQVGFAGALGWYDYSFSDARLNLPSEMYVQKPGWSDGQYVQWGCSDSEVVEQQLRQLEVQLQWLQQQVKEVVVVMHHVPAFQLLSFPWARWLVPRQWRYLNAFLGSERFQELFGQYRRLVRTVVCGHIHLAHAARVNGQKYVSIGSTYEGKQLLILEGGKIHRMQFLAA